MSSIYVDRLSLFSLLSIICSGIKYSHIFYFNTTANVSAIAKIFGMLGVLKCEPQLIDIRITDVRDEKGECTLLKIKGIDINNICYEISDREFANNFFLRKFSHYFDYSKIIFFLEKALYDDIHDIVAFINVTKWYAGNRVNSDNKPVVLFLKKGPWFSYLSHYITGLNMKPVKYGSGIDRSWFHFFSLATNFILAKIRSRLNVTGKCSNKNENKIEETPSQITDKKAPLIGAWYTGKTVTFGLKNRSDFFWFLKSDVPYDQMFLYFCRTDVPATERISEILNKEKVRSIALSNQATDSKSIPVWNPGNKYKQLRKQLIMMVFKGYLSCAFKRNFVSLFYLTNMVYFVLKYSYWYDFFDSNNIKIHVSPDDHQKAYVPKNLALRECGGVSVSYQYSSGMDSSIHLSYGCDIVFSFGSAYRWTWEYSRSQVANFIYCGYITDYAFREVKEDSLKLRRQLLDKGVKFIICYFDETPAPDRMHVISNKMVTETYEYIIDTMLEDETLGLVLKPSRPESLYNEIPSIKSMIEKAKASGRCICIDSGSYHTDHYPTEAAQIADLSVCHLYGGTTALESHLSGVRAVFLDLEKLYSNPVYKLGYGEIVFDDIDNLSCAIKQFRDNPESIPGFGDLSAWVKDRDPFKDGNASLRIGQYINWLFVKIREGKKREEAIEFANQKYAELWGRENIVDFNCINTV
jgi:hypothetical protein